MALDVLSVKDIAGQYGIPYPTVKKWSRESSIVPDARVSEGATPIFLRKTVEAFLKDKGRL